MVKNIVFDVGNVLVQWNPIPVVQKVFPELNNHDQLIKELMKSEVWIDLNKGKISEKEAIIRYHQSLSLNLNQLEILMYEVKESLLPIEGSFALVEKLSKANYPLYIITDNTLDIEAYLRNKYDFWKHFQGVVNSARLGVLKPSPLIYQHLLDSYGLDPKECVFFDDLQANVDGAMAVNMHARVFTDVETCISDLQALKIIL